MASHQDSSDVLDAILHFGVPGFRSNRRLPLRAARHGASSVTPANDAADVLEAIHTMGVPGFRCSISHEAAVPRAFDDGAESVRDAIRAFKLPGFRLQPPPTASVAPVVEAPLKSRQGDNRPSDSPEMSSASPQLPDKRPVYLHLDGGGGTFIYHPLLSVSNPSEELVNFIRKCDLGGRVSVTINDRDNFWHEPIFKGAINIDDADDVSRFRGELSTKLFQR